CAPDSGGGRISLKTLLGVANEVAAQILRPVESDVRSGEKLIQGRTAWAARCQSGTDADAQTAAGELDLADSLTHGIQQLHSDVGWGIRKDEQKLLATPASEGIAWAQGRSGEACKFLQHAVSSGMPELIIECLEPVEVDQCETD